MLAPAKTADEMGRVIQNCYVNAGLTAIFIFVVLAMIGCGLATILQRRSNPNITTREIGDAW